MLQQNELSSFGRIAVNNVRGLPFSMYRNGRSILYLAVKRFKLRPRFVYHDKTSVRAFANARIGCSRFIEFADAVFEKRFVKARPASQRIRRICQTDSLVAGMRFANAVAVIAAVIKIKFTVMIHRIRIMHGVTVPTVFNTRALKNNAFEFVFAVRLIGYGIAYFRMCRPTVFEFPLCFPHGYKKMAFSVRRSHMIPHHTR